MTLKSTNHQTARNTPRDHETIQRWEYACVAAAIALSLMLGFSNLGKPSLWHDELVHLYASRAILDTGWPSLPSGQPYPSGALFSYIQALSFSLFGVGEIPARTPAVLAGTLAVGIAWWVFRPLIGPIAALGAAAGLAFCPWSVAWAREGRFYSLQMALFLGFMGLAWRAMVSPSFRQGWPHGTAALCTHVMAVLTSLHSAMFPGGVGAFALARAVTTGSSRQRVLACLCAAVFGAIMLAGLRGLHTWMVSASLIGGSTLLAATASGHLRARWTISFCAAALITCFTLAALHYSLPEKDHKVIFEEAGLTGAVRLEESDPQRSDTFYYLRFFTTNLSSGLFMLAMAGFVMLPVRRGWKGAYVVLSWWIPVLFLGYIGYRNYRFMLYAFPCYIAAASFAGVELARYSLKYRASWFRLIAACCIGLLGIRLAWSTARLFLDSVELARGSNQSLAAHHPRWREAFQSVKQMAAPSDALLCSVYLASLYYAGRCDDWYPSRVNPYDWIDSGTPGLANLDDLKAFMARNPSGYLLVDYRRWQYRARDLAEDIAWVESHMVRIDQASNADITVYAWGHAVVRQSEGERL